MTVLLFEYGHSRIGSWDGKWSGEGSVFAKEVLLTKERKQHLESLGIDCKKGVKHKFSHDFGDGWVAEINMTVGNKKDFKEIMKASQGFMGYEWLIDSILKYGKVKQKFMIYDLQQNQTREEEYETKEEAIKSFAEYWKNIQKDEAIQDLLATGELTGNEPEAVKEEKYLEWLNEAYKSDLEYLTEKGFKVVSEVVK